MSKTINVWLHTEIIDNESGESADVEMPFKMFMDEDANPEDLEQLKRFLLYEIGMASTVADETIEGVTYVMAEMDNPEPDPADAPAP